MITHVERQSRLWGDQYVDFYIKNIYARMFELENFDFTNVDLSHSSLSFEQYSTAPDKISGQNSIYKVDDIPSLTQALTQAEADEINHWTYKIFMSFRGMKSCSSRHCWKLLEEELEANNLSHEEINKIYEVSHGLSEFSLHELEMFRFKYSDGCPLLKSYSSFEEMKSDECYLKLVRVVAKKQL